MKGHSMRRRDFGKTLLGGAVGAGLEASGIANPLPPRASKPRLGEKNTLMHVGADYHVIEGDGGHFAGKSRVQPALRRKAYQSRSRHRGDRWSAPTRWLSASQGRRLYPCGRSVGWGLRSRWLKRMRDDCDKAGMTLEGFRMDSGQHCDEARSGTRTCSTRRSRISARLRWLASGSSVSTGR